MGIGSRRAAMTRRDLGGALLGMAGGAALAPDVARAKAISSAPAEPAPRCAFWIDLYAGEPVEEEEVLDDLAGVQVVYLGERHRLARHHELQTRVVQQLAKRKVRLVLGLEQIEAVHQAALDRYVRGEISWEQLAEAIQWAQRWPGYPQYRLLIEAARQAGAPIVALNARSETIRQVARGGGIARLDPAARRELPADMQLKDPPYENLLARQMMVHAAATPERLRPMIEAQIARDEAMASALVSYLKSPAGEGRTAVVVCGAVHAAYGLGMVARVRRRMAGVKDRICHFSESGDLELRPEELAAARPITITHEELREIALPLGDYLHAVSPRPAAAGAAKP